MPYYPTPRHLPPCPDPETYIMVKGKKGYYWRQKRGTVKPAVLNAVFQANVDMMKVCSPAGSRIMTALATYIERLETDDLIGQLVSLLAPQMKASHFSYAAFVGLELQPAHPLDYLLQSPINLTQAHRMAVLQVPIKPGLVHRHSDLVSDFYLEAILLSGDPLSGQALQVNSVTSPLYSYANLSSSTCTLQLPLPDAPWLLLLKFCSLEGNQLAHHWKHYGMKAVGNG
jgi:hypothetical protein